MKCKTYQHTGKYIVSISESKLVILKEKTNTATINILAHGLHASSLFYGLKFIFEMKSNIFCTGPHHFLRRLYCPSFPACSLLGALAPPPWQLQQMPPNLAAQNHPDLLSNSHGDPMSKMDFKLS